jgi:predicted kinase
MVSNVLIILRGPSGAGKSTVAKKLQETSSHDTLIVEQDYYRHILLADRPDAKQIVPEIIYTTTLTALEAGYSVIVEGIFNRDKYLSMFQKLADNFRGETYVYYFDVPFDETVKRHSTRDKVALFGVEEMKTWYLLAGPLGTLGEQVIKKESSETETIALIKQQTGIGPSDAV